MGHLPVYAPMVAQLGPLPGPAEQEAWAVEMKWDGVRCLAYAEDGALRLLSRNGRDVTLAYPELYPLAGAVGGHDVVLDGEIVAFDEAGRPSFGALQPRMHQRNTARVAELVRTVPVTLLLFDILHVNRSPAVDLPYVQRRDLLESIVRPGARWQVPAWFHGQAEQALASSRQLGLEGVVCKRLTSPYRPGRRSAEWTKVKNFVHQDVVVGGWKPGEGRRAGTIGSLLVGVPGKGGLTYVGSVGTGFTDATLEDLRVRLAPLARATSPFTDQPPVDRPHWVEPVLIGEVQYAEMTGDGRLRHPSWRGLRAD